MITCRLYRNGEREQLDLEPSQISDVLATADTTVWLDMDEPTQEKLEVLKEEFGFHELALEDSVHPHQRAKVEQYPGYFFVVAYAVSLIGDELTEHELSAFVAHNYLVTVRKEPVFAKMVDNPKWNSVFQPK